MGNEGCTKTDAIPLRIEVKHLKEKKVILWTPRDELRVGKMLLQNKGREKEIMCYMLKYTRVYFTCCVLLAV